MSTHATKRHPKFCNNSVSQFFAHAAIKTEKPPTTIMQISFFPKFLLRLG